MPCPPANFTVTFSVRAATHYHRKERLASYSCNSYGISASATYHKVKRTGRGAGHLDPSRPVDSIRLRMPTALLVWW